MCQGDQLLRDAMHIASATSMRITDVRTISLPRGDPAAAEGQQDRQEDRLHHQPVAGPARRDQTPGHEQQAAAPEAAGRASGRGCSRNALRAVNPMLMRLKSAANPRPRSIGWDSKSPGIKPGSIPASGARRAQDSTWCRAYRGNRVVSASGESLKSNNRSTLRSQLRQR
jgi:hypothetical protein